MPLDIGSGVLFEASTTGSGTGNYDSFLRLGANGNEVGFNTNDPHLAENKDGVWTHTLLVSGLATVFIGPISYYEIRLDLNEVQSGDNNFITLEDMRIYSSTFGADEPTFNANFVVSGFTKVFDLDDPLVLDDANHGSGTDDYVFYIPTSLFSGTDFLTLYARFSDSDDGFEEFRVKSQEFTPAPDIGVLKVTNGVDDECPVILVGEDVTWTYTVENNGNLPLSNVTVTDDAGTPGDTSDDIIATYVSGDTNSDSILGLTETWIFTASGTAVGGEYTNIATVSGAWVSGETSGTVTGIEEDCYDGATPGIAIVKLTNGTDGVCPVILVGEDVTWTYNITNTGDIALSNVLVSDDNGTPLNTGDDFFANPVLSGGFNIGDANQNNLLDVTEEWQFSYTGTATAGEYTNIATVSGDATDDFQNVQNVDASENDCYEGATPGIDIVKLTNGTDGVCPVLLVGETVTWTYNVTNTGDIALSNVLVSDDHGTPGNLLDDFFANPVLSGGFNIGDANQNNLLDLTEEWQFSYTGTATDGEYTNIATVTGDATDDSQNTQTVDAEDEDCYDGVTPGIAIVKLTNGTDGECPVILVGEDVTWTYNITNAGDIALSNVLVSDDNGTPLNTGDDFFANPVLSGGFNVGDANQNNLLDLTEEWQFSYTGTAIAGEYTNIATVTGDATDDSQNVQTVDASENDCYLGVDPSIEIVKLTNGTDDVCPEILVGDAVTWTYNITNTGDIALSNIVVSDNNGSPGNTGDDFFANPVLSAGFNVGDTNQDNLLDLTEEWQFTYTALAIAGEYNNIATVTGDATYEAQTLITVDDSEDDCYYGAAPDIDIVKLTNGTDDLCPVLTVGETVTWTYNVENTGNVALTDIVITDDNGTPGASPPESDDDFSPTAVLSGGFNIGDVSNQGVFDPGEIWQYTYSGTAEAGHYDNVATVTADFTDHAQNTTTVTASENDCYVGISGPGVRTPGFWQNPNNGGQFWDGIPDNEKNAGEDCFPLGDLLYQVDKTGDGVKDDVPGLLIGDYNMNGVRDAGEDVIFISLTDAQSLINAKNNSMSDGVIKIGRDTVATWLNYLAGNPIGDVDDDGFYSPMEALDDAIDYLQIFGDANASNMNFNELFDCYSMSHKKVATSTGFWTLDFPGGDNSGADIHGALDEYNNFGTVDGVGYAHDCDTEQFLTKMTAYSVQGDLIVC